MWLYAECVACKRACRSSVFIEGVEREGKRGKLTKLVFSIHPLDSFRSETNFISMMQNSDFPLSQLCSSDICSIRREVLNLD